MGFRWAYAFAKLAGMFHKPKGKRGWTPKDFMPPLHEEEKSSKTLTPDQFFQKMVFMTKALGGKIIDKRKKKE